MQVVVVSAYANRDWAKGETLEDALNHFKELHKYDFRFFDDDGLANKVTVVKNAKSMDEVYVDDVGLLHYQDGSTVTML